MTLTAGPRVEQRIREVGIKERRNYLEVKQKNPEVWSPEVIKHIRDLSDTGEGTLTREELFEEPIIRDPCLIRDEIGLNALNKEPTGFDIDTSTGLVPTYRSIMPVYFGDMSFGALNKRLVTALVRAASKFGIISGTGEGGLYQEIRGVRGKFIQWASARFGVTLEVLQNEGLAVVIKIGQGAKPGLGGQVQKEKVTEEMAKTRRMPMGIDYISPGPHHDIYSIEDLGQRIEALKLLTCTEEIINELGNIGLPIYVKVAATNYVGYIACGIARMGATGVIIDGAGAGTGAAPISVRDHCGLPVEIALAWTDQLLRQEGLRNKVKIIAGGTVRNAIDIVKLLALGADSAIMGTAAVVATGCIMVHQCHNNKCPTLLAKHEDQQLVREIEEAFRRNDENALRKLGPKLQVLDVAWAEDKLLNFLGGLKQELMLLYDVLGIEETYSLIGNRSVLRWLGTNEETRMILGLEKFRGNAVREQIDLRWSTERALAYDIEHVQALADKGVPAVGSMGTTSFIRVKARPRDYLTLNAAQVTGPSIDLREPIETSVHFVNGNGSGNGHVGTTVNISKNSVRLSCPIIFNTEQVEDAHLHEVVSASAALGTFPIVKEGKLDERLMRYVSKGLVFVELERLDAKLSEEVYNAKGLVVNVTGENVGEVLEFMNKMPFSKEKTMFRVPCEEDFYDIAVELAKNGAGVIILDGTDSSVPLEFGLVELDSRLRNEELTSKPLRYQVNLLVQGNDIYLGSDAIKLVCLGADAVVMDSVINHATRGQEVRKRLERFIVGTKGELKLFAGANGISDIQGSMTGNRELLRAINAPPEVRERMDVKAAGWG